MGPVTETEPRWKNRAPRAMAEMFPSDLARLNALVEKLNSSRAGRWRQKDAIRYLLDCHDEQQEEGAP